MNYKIYLFLIFFNINLILMQNDIVLVENETLKFTNDQVSSENFTTVTEEFIPTKEWQKVKENQPIPKGLHVRINLQTGEREAKLLETQDEEKTKKELLNDEFKKSILELNDQQTEIDKLSQEYNEIKSKFRSYEELKSEMKDLDMLVKTENELMQELIIKYINATKKEEKLSILTDLEFYVHQYDNGILFCDMNGFELLSNELNTTDDLNLQIQIALVLGAAIQSNPKVQVFALKSNMLQLLMNKLSTSLADSMLEKELYPKLMFVLSGLIRNFPYAQNLFVNNYDGLELLSNLVKKINSIKLKTKIFTFVTDLIQEKREFDEMYLSYKDNNTNMKNEQYQKINLLKKLNEKKWCWNFKSILELQVDHNTREKILISILTLIDTCQEDFNTFLHDAMLNLKKEYVKLNLTEKTDLDDDNYFLDIINLIENILKKLNIKQEL